MHEEHLICCNIKILYQLHFNIKNIDAINDLMNPFSYCPFCGNKIRLSKEWREENS